MKKVLIVEDDTKIHDFITRIHARDSLANAVIDFARTRTEAWSYIGETEYTVISIDGQFPMYGDDPAVDRRAGIKLIMELDELCAGYSVGLPHVMLYSGASHLVDEASKLLVRGAPVQALWKRDVSLMLWYQKMMYCVNNKC